MTIKRYERIRNEIHYAMVRCTMSKMELLMTSPLFNELLPVFDIIEKENGTQYYYMGVPVSYVFVPDDIMKWWIVCGSGEG